MSHGYDTLVAAWGQIEDPAGGWQADFSDSRRGVRRAYLNTPQFQATAVSVPERNFHEVRVQASLPKVLWGQNIDELGAEGVGQALDVLHARLRDYWACWPSVDKWVLRRVDCTANRRFGGPDGTGEFMVLAVLDALKEVARRGRYPVVGDSRTSVSWRRSVKGVTWKVYSKLAETGDARAEGILRLEVQVNGQVPARRLLGRPTGDAVLVGDVLGDVGFPVRATAELSDVVGKVVEGLERMGYMRAFYRIKDYLRREGIRGGSTKAASLLGYLWLIRELGAAAVEAEVGYDQFRRVRLILRGAGVDPESVDFGHFDVAGVVPDMDSVAAGLVSRRDFSGEE